MLRPSLMSFHLIRREALKFELSLYGVTIEDLQKAGETSKAVAMDDNTAFEAQREKLRQEKERIAERKRYIELVGFSQMWMKK